MNNVLELKRKLIDVKIRELILELSGINPEEKMILLEEYIENYRELLEYEDVS